MLKIAICDDEKKSVLLIESLTKQIFQEEKIPAQITTYGNGDFLLYDIQEKNVMILFCWILKCLETVG